MAGCGGIGIADRNTSHDERRSRPPRPALAAFLSAVFPGAGQWYGGRRRPALLLAALVGAGLLGAVWLAALGPARILEIFVQTRWLWVLFAVNIVLLGARVFAVGDAFRGEQARGGSAGPPWIRWTALAALLVVTALPHLVVADYSLEAIDLLETVFVDEDLPSAEGRIEEALAAGVDPEDLGPVLSTTTTMPAPPVVGNGEEGTSAPPASGPPTTGGGEPVAPTSIPLPPPLGDLPDYLRGLDDATARAILEQMALAREYPFGVPQEGLLTDGTDRITVLLAGGDAGPQRWSLRTDVMIVATVDLATRKAALIGISRDMVQTPLPGEFATAFIDWELRLAGLADTTSTTTTTPAPPTTAPDATTTSSQVTTTTSQVTTTTMEVTTTTAAPTTTADGGTTTTDVTDTTAAGEAAGGLAGAGAVLEEAAADDPATTTTTEPFVSCRCWPDRINGLYTFTLNWFRTFPDAPDPGMEAVRRTLSLLLGIPIDYYVLVDMAGFVDLVDAIGGVEITVSESMDVAFSPAKEGEDPVSIEVEPGRHHLDGHQALAYVRDRTNSNDGNRMRRQRCMLRALADEMTPTTLVSRFPQIAAAIRTSTTTDIPLSAVPELIQIAASLDLDDITTLAIGAPAHTTGSDARGLPIVDPAKVRDRIAAVLAGLGTGDSFAESTECP